MANDLNQTRQLENEIGLRELVKLILDSKKLFILTILFFTILSVIYSLSLKNEFKSSVILEIGYSEMADGTQESIEKISDLISYLNLYQFLNLQDKNQETSFETIENKLILIETTSNSAEQNESLLTEIISNIDKRHSNLSLLKNNIKTGEISLNLETVNSQIALIKENKISDIKGRLYILSNELPIIDLEINQLEKIILDDTNNLLLLKENDDMFRARAANSPTLNQIIFSYKIKINSLNRKKSSYILEAKTLNNKLENALLQSEELFNLEQRQKILENELQMLMNQTQLKTQPISNIETNTVKPKTLLIITLGIIIGFITSILLVFINNFIKSYSESEA